MKKYVKAIKVGIQYRISKEQEMETKIGRTGSEFHRKNCDQLVGNSDFTVQRRKMDLRPVENSPGGKKIKIGLGHLWSQRASWIHALKIPKFWMCCCVQMTQKNQYSAWNRQNSMELLGSVEIQRRSSKRQNNISWCWTWRRQNFHGNWWQERHQCSTALHPIREWPHLLHKSRGYHLSRIHQKRH